MQKGPEVLSLVRGSVDRGYYPDPCYKEEVAELKDLQIRTDRRGMPRALLCPHQVAAIFFILQADVFH